MRAHRSIPAGIAVVLLAFLALQSTGAHTVQPGESLSKIASSHGTTVAGLVQANRLADANWIYVGQRLTIPGSTAAPTAATTYTATTYAATTYTVRAGDTLGLLASRNGLSVAQLVSLNGLSNPNLIRIGQVLKMPAGGTTTGSGGTGVTPPAGGATAHVVQRGDTLSGIASRYGVPQAQIVAANGITGGVIYAGQQLRLVPVTGTSGGTGTSDGTATTYTVKVGDTLSGIAIRFGTTVSALQSANGISNPNSLISGRALAIPAGGTGGGAAIACPVQGSISFMNDWGFPRSGGRFHEGNDLFAPRGRPAVATVSGTVVQTVGQLGGNQVKLYGDDGTHYYYTHLDRFGTSGRVTAGTVVGYVGNTGNAAGSATHVHFEIHPGGGDAVNPYPRLIAAC